jgi:hypothetical protein
MMIVWIIIYAIDIYLGWTTDNLFIQTIFCTLYFLNALVSVPHYESREITLRLSNSKFVDLDEGVYFFPLLGFWGQIYIPNQYKIEDKSFVHFDSRQVIRQREIKSRFEDFLISIIFPMFRKFELWNFGLCIILGISLSWCSINLNHVFFPKKTEIIYQVDKEPVYKAPEQQQKQTTENKDYKNSSNTKSDYDNSNEWEPNRTFYPNMTWDNLVVDDKYSAIVSLAKSISYVDIEGNFVWYYNSKNYYPHVYVDGYDEDQNYFYNFFTVYINKVTTLNGNTWSNSTIELSDYVSFIKNKNNISDQCYRNIRISLKPQFKNKIRWHIIDAGWGIDEPFKISLGNQYMTSLFDSERFGIPMSKTK